MTAPVQQCQPDNREVRQHTPTPWLHTRDGIEDQTYSHISRTPDGFGDVATVWGACANAEANASFIVEAVNNHAALKSQVEELKAALNCVSVPADVKKLKSQVEELTKALEPFAMIALLQDFDPAAGDMLDMPDFAITPNDVRIARSAMPLEQEKSHD